MARRFVRIAATAAQRALSDSGQRDPHAVVRDSLLAAVRAHVPRFEAAEMEAEGGFGEAEGFEAESGDLEGERSYGGTYGGDVRGTSGRWMRRGRRIVLMDL
jgi:hypothetical protein